jgi:5-methylcytosine-specific restriction endonuclease McrA
MTPLAPGRFGLQVTIGQEARDLLTRAQDLLGHRVPSGDVEAVLTLALRGLVKTLERDKFAATDHPRAGRPRSADSRHVPAEVRREAWARDGGRCTFTSDTGQRCAETRDLEYDHIDPYARDGPATAGNVRLLCRVHNQYEAERAFGADLMREKRDAARRRAAE